MKFISREQMAAEFRPFWEAVDAGHVSFPFCRACDRFHWYPMKLCPHCRSDDIVWLEISDPGTVHSWTALRHAFDPGDRCRLPYIVALVEFRDAPGVRLVTNIIDWAPERMEIGMAVGPVFDAATPSGLPLAYSPLPLTSLI